MTFSTTARRFFPVCLSLLTVTACSTSADRKLDKEKKARRALEQQVESKNQELAKKDIDLSETTKAKDAAISGLENKLSVATEEQMKMAVELDTTNKSLAEKSKRIEALSEEVKLKAELVSSTKKDLDARTARVSELEVKAAEQDKAISDLNARLAATEGANVGQVLKLLDDKTKEAQGLNEELKTARKEKEELSGKLTQAETDLNALKSEQETLKSGINSSNFAAVQTLMANLGPESLFATTNWKLRDTFKIDEKDDCVFIFNFDRKVEVVSKENMSSIPLVTNLTLLPIRVAYQKVAICKNGRDTQAQKESGHIYKASGGNDNALNLVTARTEGSCDKLKEEVKAKNVFAGNIQYIKPYAGSIDGIETFDLLRAESRDWLEYNMGSGHPDIRASSCEAALENEFTSDLVKLACRLAKGDAPSEMNVTMGCWTENDRSSQTELLFNK